MKNYVTRRLIQTIPLLFLITVVSFIILHLAPGDPTEMLISPRTRPEDRARIRANLGLDKPLYIQYGIWLKNVVFHGDLGYSLVNRRPVAQSIFERVPATLLLMGTAYLISLLIALPLGIMSAIKKYSFWDYFATVFSFLGLSFPTFWLALMAIYIFALKLNWLPGMGMSSLSGGGFWHETQDVLVHLILPASVLAFRNLAGWSRYIRASMLEVLGENYIRTARAKGLPERVVIWKHALKNAVLPLLTLIGLSLPDLISGAFIIEFLFSWPGMGLLGMNAVFQRDYSILMGDIFIGSIIVIFANLLADLSYTWADPRIRLEEKEL